MNPPYVLFIPVDHNFGRLALETKLPAEKFRGCPFAVQVDQTDSGVVVHLKPEVVRSDEQFEAALYELATVQLQFF